MPLNQLSPQAVMAAVLDVFVEKGCGMEQSLLTEMENEYKKIDKRWLSLHFSTSVGIVVLVFILECCIGWIMYATGEIRTTIPRYLWKFLILPSLLNTICIVISYQVIHSVRLSQNFKIFANSLSFVVLCFIVFTVHSAFTALYFIFAIPILLTSIYGNYRLSAITATASIVAVVVSELFIRWDADKVSALENGIRLGNFLISLFVLIVFFVVSIVIIYFEQKKNEVAFQKEMERYKLRQRLKVDELTGIYNRIAFRDAIRDMEEEVSASTYIFVMIDIDNFKLLNDTAGHVEGDNCLIEFGRILKENTGGAIPFRYGGDEFCILFKNAPLSHVLQSCERIKRDFQAFTSNFTTDLPVTASFGVAFYTDRMPPSQLIMNTDKALYRSKIVKNAITVFDRSLDN